MRMIRSPLAAVPITRKRTSVPASGPVLRWKSWYIVRVYKTPLLSVTRHDARRQVGAEIERDRHAILPAIQRERPAGVARHIGRDPEPFWRLRRA